LTGKAFRKRSGEAKVDRTAFRALPGTGVSPAAAYRKRPPQTAAQLRLVTPMRSSEMSKARAGAVWGRIAVRMASHNGDGKESLGVPLRPVVDGTAFQERSSRWAKVLLECDRRSTKIEIGNAEKEGGFYSYISLLPAVAFDAGMAVV
jgi:hypothetical protein